MPKRRGRNTGAVNPHGKGRWRAAYCVTRGGTRCRGSKVCGTKAEAEEWLRGQLAAPTAAGTVGEWLARWLALHRPDVAPKTYRHDAQRAARWLVPRLGPVRLRDLTGLRVREMLRDMAAEGASDSERQKAGAVLRKALNAAVGMGVIPANPMLLGGGRARVRLPTPKRPDKRVFTPEELPAVLAAAAAAGLEHVFRLWLDAGLRPAELFALEWGDLDLAAGTVAVRRALDADTHRVKEPKTRKSRRTLPLAPSTVAHLAAARPAGGGLVLPDSAGGYFWESNFAGKIFKPLVAAAGCPWATPYTCRHTMATLLIRAGVPLKVVSERLGHEDVTTTLRTYTHVLEGDQQRAAAEMERILGPTNSPRAG